LRTEGITIIPTAERLGGFESELERHDGKTDLALLSVYLAGWCAEWRHNPDADRSGSRQDFEKAHGLLARINKLWSEDLSLEGELEQIDELVTRLWPQIEAVATALLEEDTLLGEDARKICDLVSQGENWREGLKEMRRIRG
jgi:hypothetical protein